MSLLFGGKNVFNSLPRQLFFTGRFELLDDLKEMDEFIKSNQNRPMQISSVARN